MSHDTYSKISRASDLKNPGDRFLYRLLEMVPGFLSFGTFAGVLLLSWRVPTLAALLIIGFVLYWLFRTLYLSFHLQAGFKKMRSYEQIDWFEKLKTLPQWERMYHLIVIPTFREPYEVLRQTILGLRLSDYPKNKLIVVLGIEESEKTAAQKKADELRKEFGKAFFQFFVTVHPQNLPGEIPSKGSNETWATKEVVKHIIMQNGISIRQVIVSSFDADTVVFKGYLSCLTYHFLTVKNPFRASFQPIPVFFNNIFEAPAISQIFSFSSTFWNTMNQGRPEKLITFSSHSMSLQALLDVGYKQTNVVSDDSRIFWQCFLHYNGDYRVEPLYYPVSMDANVGTSFVKTLIQIYKQQRRWAYGVADIPYFIFGFLKNNNIALSKKISFTLELLESHWTWAVAPIVLFFFGWFPLLLGGEHFSHTLLSYNLPRFTSRVLTLAMIGLVTSVVISIHLLPERRPAYGKWRLIFFVAQWFLFPFTMIFFAALPALDAQIRLMFGKYLGFWLTPKIRSTRSKARNLET